MVTLKIDDCIFSGFGHGDAKEDAYNKAIIYLDYVLKKLMILI